MNVAMLPTVGEWYRRPDRPQVFQVVAFDEDAGTVDIEYFDGTVDEWPLTHWQRLELEPCGAPQDWTGPFDDVERDEYTADDGLAPQDRIGDELAAPPALNRRPRRKARARHAH